MSDVDRRDPPPPDDPSIDWSLTTWEGSRREQLRRWAELPLDRIILALEEMELLGDWFRRESPKDRSSPPP